MTPNQIGGCQLSIPSIPDYTSIIIIIKGTGKSLSEALILGSTKPQYDKRLFIDLLLQYMKTTSSEHGENMCAQIVLF